MKVKQEDTKVIPRTLPAQVGEIATGLSAIIQKMDEAKEKDLKNKIKTN
ncbi:protein of unknown function [Petrocella atlantisensis]|uniref:Uncharacterized protein n=1 Tax=Petrocella atlantisensis TaxID=2173034 RepID=A0A3P7P2D2_9FIRM|nr:hypothetical protein [Petrocella atlantisensis]VDN47650.1 protein of unknown function [Petrocella atlantisensis]